MYTEEETKIMEETSKILDDPMLDISATCVRCPIERGHSMSVEVTTDRALSLEDVCLLPSLLTMVQPSLVFTERQIRPSEVAKTHQVYVRRLRINQHNNRHLSAFLTLDNLYRGASYNSYEIARDLSLLP